MLASARTTASESRGETPPRTRAVTGRYLARDSLLPLPGANRNSHHSFDLAGFSPMFWRHTIRHMFRNASDGATPRGCDGLQSRSWFASRALRCQKGSLARFEGSTTPVGGNPRAGPRHPRRGRAGSPPWPGPAASTRHGAGMGDGWDRWAGVGSVPAQYSATGRPTSVVPTLILRARGGARTGQNAVGGSTRVLPPLSACDACNRARRVVAPIP